MSNAYFRSRPISNFKPATFMFDATNVQFMSKPLQRTRQSSYPNKPTIVESELINRSSSESIENDNNKSDDVRVNIENKSDENVQNKVSENTAHRNGQKASFKGPERIDVWNISSHGETAADSEIRLLAKESKVRQKHIKSAGVAKAKTRDKLENTSDHAETTAEKEFRLLAIESNTRKKLAKSNGENETTTDTDMHLLVKEAKSRRGTSPRKQTITNRKLINSMPTQGLVASRRSSLASNNPLARRPPANDARARRASMACTRRAALASGRKAPLSPGKPLAKHTSPLLKQVVENVDAEMQEKEEVHDDILNDINKEYEAMLKRKKRRNRASKAR